MAFQTPWDLLAVKQPRTYDPRQQQSPVSQEAQQSAPPVLPQEQNVLRAMRRQSSFMTMPFTVGTSPILLRSQEDRTYFFIQNNSGANALYVGFGAQPSSSFGIILTAGGAYEPYQVPMNDVWITGSAAGTVGTLIYSIGNL